MNTIEYRNQIERAKSETEINRECVKYVERLGFEVYRMNSGKVKKGGAWIQMQKKNCPDYLINVHGRFVWFEGKKRGEKPTEGQKQRFGELIERGDFVIATDNYDDFIKVFKAVEILCFNGERPEAANIAVASFEPGAGKFVS